MKPSSSHEMVYVVYSIPSVRLACNRLQTDFDPTQTQLHGSQLYTEPLLGA